MENTKNTPSKGKKISTSTIVGIGLLTAIVVVLQFTGVSLNGSKKFSPKNDEEVRVSKDVTVEEDTTKVSEEEQIIIEIRELYEQKCYIEAIDIIINLDMEIFTEKQVKSILYILEESIYSSLC